MSQVTIVLPDNSTKVFDHEPTTLEVAQSIGPRLAKDTLGAKINGSHEVIDLRLPLKDGTKLEIVTVKSKEANDVIRHSAAHVMAQAVQELWPEVKVTIGPVIDEGFYYDFDSPRSFTEEDFAKIEVKMAEIVAKDYPLNREEWSSEKAIETFSKMQERFKVEIIRDLKTPSVSVYHQGPWFDLCRGPHVQSTGQIKAFKLMSVAGAYWRGDEKNPMLQRLYATAFKDKKELDEYLHRLEEAKKRDHRKLGKELDLFYFSQLAPASPFFTGKGSIVYNELIKYIRELYHEFGYQEVITPQIFDVQLYHTSGHYENYKENMYFSQVDEREFSMKPMNCPGHCVLFSMTKHSYRDLPLRIADFGRLHRNERAGAIHGLTRVRTFCQDDAHIFCTMEQLQEEIKSFVSLLNQVYQKLGMTEYHIYLSTRPEKRMGSDEVWDKAEAALGDALKVLNLPYTVNPGDGAFYGPKLDIMFVDAIKRPWQLGTIQCDFNLPKNFELKYTGEDNVEHQPVMLHRAILGSLERFIGVYLEHVAGHLPTWLAPVQVQILNVTDRVNGFCEELKTKLHALGVRVNFDSRNEKLNYKIREAQMQKIPYMVVVGDKEAEAKQVSIRLRDGSTVNNLQVDDFVNQLLIDIKERRLKSPLTSNQDMKQEVPINKLGPNKDARGGFGKPLPKKDKDGLRVNHEIRAPQIRVIDDEGTMLGVMTVPEALRIAEERGLDLLEIAPTATPPTCKIMDYGKWKYENKKKQAQARKKQVIVTVKEIQVRPRTDQHDLDTKMKHSRRFLLEGDKVKFNMRFMGREMAHTDLAMDVFKKIKAGLEDICLVEAPPKIEGRGAFMIIAPDPVKVKEYLKLHPKGAGKELPPLAAEDLSETSHEEDDES